MDIIKAVKPEQWLIFLLGILVPMSFQFLLHLVKAISKFKTITPYINKWYVYHWSREDYKSTFREEIWEFKRGFLKPLVVRTSDNDRKKLKYKGYATFEADHIVINLRATKHREETWQVRIQPDPIPGECGNGNAMRGIMLDQDFSRRLYAAVMVGKMTPIDVEDAKEALKRITELNCDESCIRMRDVPTSLKSSSDSDPNSNSKTSGDENSNDKPMPRTIKHTS